MLAEDWSVGVALERARGLWSGPGKGTPTEGATSQPAGQPPGNNSPVRRRLLQGT